jgi:hypothetical protein
VARVAEIPSLPRATLSGPTTVKACAGALARAIGGPRNRLTGIINVSRALRRFRLAEFGRPILHQPGSQGLPSRRAKWEPLLALRAQRSRIRRGARSGSPASAAPSRAWYLARPRRRSSVFLSSQACTPASTSSVTSQAILVRRVIAKIKELKEQKRLTVLMAEQNFNQAIKIADRAYVMVHGQIEFEGKTAAELADNPMIKRYYLGG